MSVLYRPQALVAPLQWGWPHWQATSVLPASPSQWALQYFEPSGGTQEQAEFAHFLGEAISFSFVPDRLRRAQPNTMHCAGNG